MEEILLDNEKRKKLSEIYNKLFKLIDSNSKDQDKINYLINEFEKFGIHKTNMTINKKSTVCSNFVIEILNYIFKFNIPIVRSFENYDNYIGLLNKKQKEELIKIEKKLNLNEKTKKEIYGIYIFEEILNFYNFKKLNELVAYSIIIYYGNSFGKKLPEHVGFLLDDGLVISKFGIINEIFIHPIENIPSSFGNKYEIYKINIKDFHNLIKKYFEK